MADEPKPDEGHKSLDFIREIVSNDVKAGKNDGKVVTRFPPEPNGYLHLGHAMAFALSFALAEEFGECVSRTESEDLINDEAETTEV